MYKVWESAWDRLCGVKGSQGSRSPAAIKGREFEIWILSYKMTDSRLYGIRPNPRKPSWIFDLVIAI